MAKRRISVLVLDENNPTTWRPATAFPASRHQRTIFRKRGRQVIIDEMNDAADFDAIDEQTLEAHDGHPVKLTVTVALDDEESQLVAELAQAEGTDPPGALRAALRHYAAARSQRVSH